MNIQDLYQELIIDHGTHPRHQGEISNASTTAVGFNPLCGDRIQLYVRIENNVILEATFTGSGCAISTAAASLMCEAMIGQSIPSIVSLSHHFKTLLTTGALNHDNLLGKLQAFSGVRAFPARVKCATLPWHTLEAALENQSTPVTTEILE